MDTDDLDELLALLSDGDATEIAAVEKLFWGDTDGIDAQLAPLLALEVEATNTLSRRERQQSKETEAKCDDTQPQVTANRSSEHKRLTKKEEMALLHAQVESLTARLKTLKVAAGIGIDTPVARVLPEQTAALASSSANEARKGLGLWVKLAARQLERRQASEQENRALRAAVTMQSRRAKRLRLMMQKRAARAQEEFAGMLQRPQLLMPLSLRDDQQVLETLARSIDKTYATIDSTFSQAKMHKVPRPGRLSSGRGLGPGRWSIEVRDVYMVPFALSQTERAVWNVISNGAIHHEAEARRSFQFTFQLPIGVSITMHERSVARRYRDQDRTIIITCSITQPTDSVSVHGTRCIVVKRGEETTSGPTTVIETYLTGCGAAPAESLALVDDEMRRLRLSNPSLEEDEFGLKLWARSVSRMHAEVEDALMEPSVGEHAPPSQ